MTLSPREEDVLLLAVKGLRNKEIGVKLKITEKTVKFHMSSIFRKFGVSCRPQLFAKIFGDKK